MREENNKGTWSQSLQVLTPWKKVLTLEFVCGFILTTIVFLILLQIITRLFSFSLNWAAEIVRYSFTWFSFLTAALVMKYNGHIAVTFLVDVFPHSLRRWTIALMSLVVILFLGVLIIMGIKMMIITHGQTSAGLEIPLSLVYASLPVSSMFMLVYGIRHLISGWKEGGTS